MSRTRVSRSNNRRKQSPAATQAGRQVFAGNIDEVLAEKIVKRTKENAGGPSGESRPDTPETDTCRCPEGGKKIACMAVCAAMMIALAWIIRRLVGGRTKKPARKKR